MRVLYLCSDLGIPLDGHKGAAAHVRGFVAALRKLGAEVEVISPNCGTFATRPVPTSHLFDKLETEIPKAMSRALRHITSNTLVEGTVREAISDNHPDLIYERYSPFSIAGGIVAEAEGIPHILEVNAPLSREGAAYRGQALPEVAEAMEMRAFATAGHILTVSEELRGELADRGIEKDKITAIPNGVDTDLFSGAFLPSTEHGDSERLTIGFVGSLRPWHDIGAMLRCFRTLLDDPRFHFLVVGDGPEMKKVNAFQNDYPDRITVTGALDHHQVPKEIAKMDIALAPYPKLERFYFSPLKILEYMAGGCAIVGSDIGQVSTLLEHGKTGLLAPPGDDEAMTAAIRRLADPETRIALAAEAKRVAMEQHDWQHRVARILTIGDTLTPKGGDNDG